VAKRVSASAGAGHNDGPVQNTSLTVFFFPVYLLVVLEPGLIP